MTLPPARGPLNPFPYRGWMSSVADADRVADLARRVVADHFCGPGGMANDQLYLRVDEQQAALREAGFTHVTELLREGGLVLHRAA